MQIEAGMVLSGKVSAITKFGAFVEFGEGKTGLIHISEIAEEYVENVDDYLKRGQVVSVKVIGTDKGKISLSLKQVSGTGENTPQSGADIPKRVKRNKKDKSSEPRSTQPPAEFEFKKKNSDDMSFDDMLKAFKRDSEEKIRDLKRSHDNKRSGGYTRGM